MAGRTGRLIPLATALAAPVMLAGSPPSDVAQALAGRVSQSFPDGTIDGASYTGNDIAEIVPVGQGAAYVRVHLDYYNGHQCGIAGVAIAEGNRLVYHAPHSGDDGRPACTLSLARNGRSLVIDDAGGSCSGYCGLRGTLSGVSIPWSSHRPITYLARLRTSPQYRDALAEWRVGKTVR